MENTEGGWGYSVSVDANGVEHRTPLAAPAFRIPEGEREYIDTGRLGLVMWTRKPSDESSATPD